MKSTSSRGEKKYLITFIDNCIRNDYVNLLNGNNEAIEMSTQYNIQVELVRKTIGSDKNGEYKSLCLKSGIIHQTDVLFSSI